MRFQPLRYALPKLHKYTSAANGKTDTALPLHSWDPVFPLKSLLNLSIHHDRMSSSVIPILSKSFFCVSVSSLSNLLFPLVTLQIYFNGSSSFKSYSQILLIAVIWLGIPIRNFSIISEAE